LRSRIVRLVIPSISACSLAEIVSIIRLF
jgi:hypothetical protein